jgi:hypothetical protein
VSLALQINTPVGNRLKSSLTPAYELFLKAGTQLIRFRPDSWQRPRAGFEQ